MSWTCMRTAQLIAARAAGLSEGDRLRLEEHLQTCEACRAEARALDALAALAGQADRIALSDRAMSRLVTTALRGGAETVVAPVASRRPWLVLAGVGVAAAAGVAVWMAQPSPQTVAAPAPVPAPAPAPVAVPAPVPAAANRLVSGDLASDTAILALGDELPAGAVHTMNGARAQLAHADITLSPASSITWRPEAATVELAAGTLVASVDPAPHRAFAVATERFTVEVVGTRFEVTPDGVRVFEGVVRVRAPSGALLVEALGAGGRWHVDEPVAAAPAAAPRGNAARLLVAARQQLAAGHADDARELIAQARRARPTRVQRAEADTLLAECALVDGDRAAAAKQYRLVANRYTDLPAGESALYAAAGLEAKSGHTAEARKLAALYLKRHPDGRFAREIEALLAKLD